MLLFSMISIFPSRSSDAQGQFFGRPYGCSSWARPVNCMENRHGHRRLACNSGTHAVRCRWLHRVASCLTAFQNGSNEGVHVRLQAGCCLFEVSVGSASVPAGRSSGCAVVSGPCLGPYSSAAVGGLGWVCMCRIFRKKQVFRIVAEGIAKIFQETQLKLLGCNSYTVFSHLQAGTSQRETDAVASVGSQRIRAVADCRGLIDSRIAIVRFVVATIGLVVNLVLMQDRHMSLSFTLPVRRPFFKRYRCEVLGHGHSFRGGSQKAATEIRFQA